MPSFFFHVGIDLDLPSPPSSPYLASQTTFFPQHKRPRTSKETDANKSHNNSPSQVPSNNFASSNTPSSPLTNDYRASKILLQNIDMAPVSSSETTEPRGSSGSRLAGTLEAHDQNGFSTKGRFEPSIGEEEELGWGVVRLYRDSDETPGLDENNMGDGSLRGSWWDGGSPATKRSGTTNEPVKDDDCTTLCILAVPSYLTPSDFLGFVGEKTRGDISHFRMVRTERANRYMVLMKFRSGRRARDWQKEWNGRAFNTMESENCHVVFVKSIKFRAREPSETNVSFPDMTNDPFTPATVNERPARTPPVAAGSSSLSLKPMAPPTPSLVELPTCPVCLERMDESTGLVTVLCQHVFHCNCLQKWRGSGCPVCRYTQSELNKHQEAEAGLNECTVCRSDVNLWICLICGNVGCGRYDAAHAFLHYKQTGHTFSMDLLNQRVWDYETDGYVHRIMQSKSDGKLVELASATGDYDHGDGTYEEDNLPREKLDNISREYTLLVTSQLESQRTYFEEKLERAADKASSASRDAAAAAESVAKAVAALSTLQLAHDELINHTIPSLEKDRDRSTRRADKFEGMARKLEKEWREEKAVNSGLMERVEAMDKEVKTLRTGNAELKEMNRDMSFFISGQEKLKDLGEEVQEGTVSLPEEKKGKGKGKKKAGGS